MRATPPALRSAKVLAGAGVLRPFRPSTVLRLGHTLLAWGAGPAAVCISAAARYPDEVGLVDDRGVLTFAEIEQRSNALADNLAARGIGEGDAVALMCRNHRYFLDATFAVTKLGADILYLNTAFAAPQLVEVLERARPETVIADEEFQPLLADLDPAIARLTAWTEAPGDENDLAERPGTETCEALIRRGDPAARAAPDRKGRATILTSGTTGVPKGVGRDTTGLDAGAALLSRIPMRARMTTHVAAPLFHTWGWGNLMLGLLLGSRLVLTRRFDPAGCLALVEQHSCDALVAIPVMLQRILDQVGPDGEHPTSYDVSHLEVVAASGSALPGDLATRWMDAYGDNLFNVYGSTEVAWATVATPEDLRAAPGTAGRPPPGTVVAVFDEEGSAVAPGETGRIFVGNSMVFEGYDGGGSREARGGLVATGDLGRFDDDGRLFVEGRSDEMIVSGGENVFPQEVEGVLLRHPDVDDVAAVGVDDEAFGQRLRAFVVVRPGAHVTEDDLRDFVRANLARYKVPRDVVFLGELPRNATGKLLKRQLAEYDDRPERGPGGGD